MHEFKVGEHSYRSGKLNARQQFHVSRRLLPLVGEMAAIAPVMSGFSAARQAALAAEIGDESAEETMATASGMQSMLVPFSRALAGMADAECDYVLDHCLAVVQRLTGGNGAGAAYGDVWNQRARRIMFEDIDMMQMIQISAEVLMDNLSGFFATPLPAMPSQSSPEQRNFPG